MERKADPVTVENTVKKAGRIVVQAGTVIGDIHPPSNRRAGVMVVGILCAVVTLVGAVMVVLVLQALPDTVADDAPTPAPVVTSTVVAPTSTSAPSTTTAATPKDVADAPATIAVTRTSTAAAPAGTGAAPATTTVTPVPPSTSTTTTVVPTTSSGRPSGGYLPY